MERFGVSMERDLLVQLDALAAERGYPSRSEVLRDLVRAELVARQWEDPRAEVVGTVTIVYAHESHDLAHTLADLQHCHHQEIVCNTHVHLNEANCLEVVIVRGASKRVREIADTLISTRGVKHGRLVCTTTGNSRPSPGKA